MALGLFIGSIPIFGFHAPLVLGFCLWFRLDAVISYLFANISNPLFAPFLLTAEVQIGTYLRTGAFLTFDREFIRTFAFSRFAGDLFLGSPFFAAGAALTGGTITYAILLGRRRLNPNPPPVKPYTLPERASLVSRGGAGGRPLCPGARRRNGPGSQPLSLRAHQAAR